MKKTYAIIDIETTGGSANREKITEIAVAIFDGERIIRKWESLINPERSIPPFITRLTGIDNEMVKDAPKFYEVARELVELTEDSIFVAHNVRFDYGFIQEEFRRLGYHYSRPKLCTVRMSREAFPGLRSYSLGQLIKHFRIDVPARHRAMADVMATVEVFKNILLVKGGVHKSETLFRSSLKSINLPESLSIETIMELPEETGVYYFLDADDQIIYVGKSVNIRKRIRQHFQNINPKSNKLYQRTARISYDITGSELIAFLLENENIKKFQPEINRASRNKIFEYFIHYYLDTSGYLTFDYAKNTLANRKNKQILTEHANLLSVKSALKQLQRKYELCEKYVGLHHGEGTCFDFGIQKCHGACVRQELPEIYNERAFLASKSLDKIDPENVLLIDRGPARNERSIILVKDGDFQGYACFDQDFAVQNAADMAEFIPKMTFNPEKNGIIKRFIQNPGTIQLIPF